jgi:uncharacterized protein YjbI with pentapeptide repeats
VLLYVLAAIFLLPSWIVSLTSPSGVQPGDRLKAMNDVRGTLLGVLIPVAAAIGGAAAWLSLRTTQAQLEETRRQNEKLFSATERQLDLSLKDQVNERFSRAVDQLGNTERLDVRIGAIYSLEQIARDAPGLHWPIVEMLTAFIREHTKQGARAQSASSQRPREQTGPSETAPVADIQALLTVLRRRDASHDLGILDLNAVNLEGADLSGANLRGALLYGANLRRALLSGANLQKANLVTAQLEGADLKGANLQGASLTKADLRRANISEASLQDADLRWVDLREASLYNSNLRDAFIGGADLERAVLSQANLQGTYFPGSNLQLAHLRGADLGGANLNSAELNGANLKGAKLHRATFEGEVSVKRDDFNWYFSPRMATGLTWEQLNEAEGVNEADLPAYLTQAPAHQQEADDGTERS